MTSPVNLLNDILSNLQKASSDTAFFIDGKSYSYATLSNRTAAIYRHLATRDDSTIGIYAANDLETYASILAVLFSGKTYVILHPAYPQDRNLKIARLGALKTVLSASAGFGDYLAEAGITLITTPSLVEGNAAQITHTAPAESNAYIIFTSGSTGEPKGVPISRGNLNAFYDAYRQIGWKLNASDRMLQMFELTFDVSVVSTLYPLTFGASIYTIGHNEVKYLKVFELLEDHQLTFAAVAPSVLQLISPFFSEIQLPALKYLVVTAEASQVELLQQFRPSIPNAEIYNLYGPTEATIYCTYYCIPHIDDSSRIKQHNGMVAIGKPFAGTHTLIVDEQGCPQPHGTQGEMWVSGPQVMQGYFNAPEKTAEAITVAADGKRYYKTGDLCIMDADEDIIYCGRKDYQVKIQGFRIELSEIEYTAKHFFTPSPNVVVIPIVKAGICSELHMAVEVASCDRDALYAYLAEKLPHYMLPKQIHCLAPFPTSASNKIDRKQITQYINNQL